MGDAGWVRARGVGVQYLIRISSSTGSADTGLRMTGNPSQFGFDIDDAGFLSHEPPAAVI